MTQTNSVEVDAPPVTLQSLNDALSTIWAQPRPNPDVIYVSGVHYAAMQAAVDFQHRDRRRIKREIRKAMDRARRERHDKTELYEIRTAAQWWHG